MTNRSGSLTGSLRNKIWSISVKIAVFAPIPSASESVATMANSGLRRRPRMARRKSPVEAVIAALTGGSGEGLPDIGPSASARGRIGRDERAHEPDDSTSVHGSAAEPQQLIAI